MIAPGDVEIKDLPNTRLADVLNLQRARHCHLVPDKCIFSIMPCSLGRPDRHIKTHESLEKSTFVDVTRMRGRSSVYSMPETSRQMRWTNASYSDTPTTGT